MRLFVAVDVPAPIVEQLRRLDRPAVPDLRWATEAQWHVTLRFLGQVDEDALPALVAALDDTPTALAGVSVDAVLGPVTAWFPGRRVLQLPVAGLEAAASAVAAATAEWGVAPEHPYRGHLTLARVRGRRPGPAELAGAPLAARWRVPALILYSSVPGRGGSRYAALHRLPLGPS